MDILPKPHFFLARKEIPQARTGVPGLLPGCLLHFGVRSPCSYLHSSCLEDSKTERKDSLSSPLCSQPSKVNKSALKAHSKARSQGNRCCLMLCVLEFWWGLGFSKVDNWSKLDFFAFAVWSILVTALLYISARIQLQVITPLACCWTLQNCHISFFEWQLFLI